MWLRREGKYFLELGESALGALIRIDNYLDKLPEHLKKLNSALGVIKARQDDIKEELEKKENYADEIERLTRKLEKIDEELGVKKK